MAGPALLDPEGNVERSMRRLPSLGTELLRQTMLYRLLPPAAIHAGLQKSTEPLLVDAITGAALFVRRSCWRQIGLLDPGFFMFYEDTDWCYRVTRAGWRVSYVPHARIMHVKSAASSRYARTRTLLESQRSLIHFFRKHYGAGSIKGLRGVALIGGLARLTRALMLYLIGVNRPDQRARMQAYSRMIWWGLSGRGLGK
jgi:GT2 family glycosyltransferase